MEDMGTRFLQDRVRAAKAKADALKAELLQAEHESAHLASEIEKAERRAFLEEEKNERETQTRNSIRKFLQEAKLPQKLPPRSFRREANRIAEYWENHGLESGLTFTSLMCLCQALPKTDWSLLEKYPDTFQELSSMERFTTPLSMMFLDCVPNCNVCTVRGLSGQKSMSRLPRVPISHFPEQRGQMTGRSTVAQN
uniref:Uncharacterized protein n=1 Tax=Pyricularia oryzae (strain P131) TaxID=1143193 RepID=L7IQ38_PYRO1